MLKLSNYSNFLFKNISFSLEENKNLAILGNNGSGKTTLAKVLSSLIDNDNITIADKQISNIWGEDRRKYINYIPTKLEIFDEYMSVDEFLQLSHFNKTISIDEVLQKLNINHLRNKICKKLSSGESQLVLIASGFLHGAKYTIFDEIIANLDPLRQKNIFEIFKNDDLLDSKIIITHNLNFAYKLGYDLLYLNDGKVIFEGSNKEFFEQGFLDKLFLGSVKNFSDYIVVDI